MAVGCIVRVEQRFFQVWESVPVGRQVLQFSFGNAPKHGSVNIPALCLFRRIHVAGDIQVVVVLNNFLAGNSPGKLLDLLRSCHIRIHNALNVAGTQLVVFAVLFKTLGRVNDQNVRILLVLPQHHDDGGNACTEENIGGQTNDSVDIVVVNQIFANRTFLTATEQNAVRQNDGHNALVADVVQVVQQESIVRLALGRKTILRKTRIIVLASWTPWLGVRRV